jgi:hypothetical protein
MNGIPFPKTAADDCTDALKILSLKRGATGFASAGPDVSVSRGGSSIQLRHWRSQWRPNLSGSPQI